MRTFAIACLLLSLSFSASASEREELQNLLNQFLAGAANSAAVHQRFWADDLIYTSSSGQRFGKAFILQGLKEEQDQPVTSSYSAENIDIRLYGDTAVVAFKLIGEDTASGKSLTSHYYNTGTFLKRDGEWRAVAWQATKIPDAAINND